MVIWEKQSSKTFLSYSYRAFHNAFFYISDLIYLPTILAKVLYL